MTKRQPPQIFNRKIYRKRRERSEETFAQHDFLHQRAMNDIIDRLETVTRDFPQAVFYGAGSLINRLPPKCGVECIISSDLAPNRLGGNTTTAVVYDEELVPFAPAKFDLIISMLTLHTVNDLIGALAQARMSLKPDGLFIAAIFGEDTLSNLKASLFSAESEITGGVSPRVAPFASIQDFGQAMTRAGFALPVVDIDKVRVSYTDPFNLLSDLRGMGETSSLLNKAAPLHRETLSKALENFTVKGAAEQFDIVYLTGWAPHESQQKPLRPGAGKSSFEEAVKKHADEVRD